MTTILTFGELMLRLSPPGYQRFQQASSFDATFGGGEANVAVSLAQYGLHPRFLSKLPSHEIGQMAVNSLRALGVDTTSIVRGGDRIGVYFLENGASQRGSKVIYDRAHAAVTTLSPDEIDFEALFDGTSWLHWTGITPALGSQATQTLRVVLEEAKQRNVCISCDLNYRKKLWTVAQAQETMRSLMPFVNVCIANEEDAEKSLGLKAGSTDVEAAHLDTSAYATLLHQLKDTYGFDTVAITLRESFSASDNGWSAIMLDDKDCAQPYQSNRYDIRLVDRVGGGDAFAGGLIAGLLTKDNTQDALEFAVAASCLKQTIPGDYNRVSYTEVDALWQGGGAGRVDR